MPAAADRYDAFGHRLDAFVHNVRRMKKGHVEALHRTRVASRRLRELVPLLQLDRDTARKLGRRLRRVTKRLGEVRDLDVLMLLIDELQQDRRYPRTALKEIAARIEPERAAARERLSTRLPSSKLDRLAHRLERESRRVAGGDAESSRADGRSPRRAWAWASEARLARRAARAQALIEDAGLVYMPERLHRVRGALRKLRYAAELSATASRKRTTADVAVLKAAQEGLGRLHDRVVLIGWARQAQAMVSASDIKARRDLESLMRKIENDCRQLHARYIRNRTRLIAIADRMTGRQPSLALFERAAG